MATYKVGGLSPFNKLRSIHDAIEKARAGDEIFWNKSEKFTEAIYVESGVHIIGNHSKVKVPEHQIGIVLKGRGHVILEGLDFVVTNLANAINVNEWEGTIEIIDCKVSYAKRIRDDKAYPLFVTGKHQKNLKVIIRDSSIEGLSVSVDDEMLISNSTIDGKIVHGVLRANSITLKQSSIGNAAISSNIYNHNQTVLFGRVIVNSSDGLIEKSTIGESESRASLLFKGNFQLSGVDFSGGIDSLFFEDGTVDLDDVSIPLTEFVTKDVNVNIHANVTTAGPWKKINTNISNRTQEELEHETSKRALQELNEMIGLKRVKDTIENYVGLARIKKARELAGLENVDSSLHLVFSGSPGTGKTTVAHLFAKALYEEGILPTQNVISARRADLVSDKIGGTALKTRAIVEKAIGGVLFIDEAYELKANSDRDFANEAVAELIAIMEENRKNLIVILAGYTSDMKSFFKEGNQGLDSRFNNWVEFPDYSLHELVDIMKQGILSKYVVDDRTMDSMELKLFALHKDNLISGNARFIRNFIQQIVFAQSLRLNSNKDLSLESIEKIELEDVETAYTKFREQIIDRQNEE